MGVIGIMTFKIIPEPAETRQLDLANPRVAQAFLRVCRKPLRIGRDLSRGKGKKRAKWLMGFGRSGPDKNFASFTYCCYVSIFFKVV
jgi:hypothetical protein